MDIRIILSTFFVIFLAELGDKTQFAAMAASSGSNQPVSVLIGAILALSLSSVIAVAAGSLIGKYIPVKYIKIAAGALFLIFGLLYLREAFVPEKKEAEKVSVSINFIGESVLKAASVFEEREIQMLKDAAEMLSETRFIKTIEEIISEEEAHLESISAMHQHDFRFDHTFSDENVDYTALEEKFECSEDTDCLIRDIYDREKAMSDFYRITAEKTRIESVRNALLVLHEDEKKHAVKIKELLT